MANLTPREQLMLELVNRARMDPNAEAARYGIALNKGLNAGTISSAPKQVLAGNDKLLAAADRHSSWMLSYNLFQHEEAGDYYSPGQRMALAGYSFTGSWSWGENIAMVGTTGTLDLSASVVQLEQNLFLSAGHRENILGDSYREVGIGLEGGHFSQGSTTFNTAMVTQDFGKAGTAIFITGVVYTDTVKANDFYDIGEQTVGRAVSAAGAATDTTGAGGGYELAFTSGGSKSLSFALASGTVKVGIALGTSNLKLDIVNSNEVWTNASATAQSTNIKEMHALGISTMSLTGSNASEKIYGNAAANLLVGNGGHDLLVGNGGGDTFVGGAGSDTLTGGAGADHYVFKLASDSGVGSAHDVITDFQDSGTDIIDLGAVFGGTLTYRGTAALTAAGQIDVTASGSDVIVHVELDTGHAGDEMQILLKGTTLASMSASDFIL